MLASSQRLSTVVVALATLVARHPALARRPKPTACDAGAFTLDAQGSEEAAARFGVAIGSIAIAADGHVDLAGCAAAGHRKVTRHRTIVTATFATCGSASRVHLKAIMGAPACDAVRGTLRARRKKRATFTATRARLTTVTTTTLGSAPVTTTTTLAAPPPATCRNGILDPGEQCDHDPQCGRHAICTPDCTCLPLPGEPEPTTEQKIDDALQAGRIDYGTSLLYRAYAFYGDARLPPEFDGDGVEEDIALSGDVAAAQSSLAPDIRATLASLLVRPTDPSSVFSAPPGVPAGRGVPADAPPPCGPTACANWVSTPGTDFVVWSCDSVDEGTRAAVLADAESLYAPMTGYMGEPVPDTEGGSPAIDIYIVDTGNGVLRDGACKPLDRSDGAVGCAYWAPQNLGTLSGAPISSGFIEILLSQVGSPGRKSTLAHEFFHVLEFAYNRDATHGSWLAESSAVWAQWRFVPETADSEVHNRFPKFQDRDNLPLPTTRGDEPYDAYIFHLFAQQEIGADAMKRIWSALSGNGVAANYDFFVNQVIPFKDHFGEFALRNLNNFALLKSGSKTYGGTLSSAGLDHPPPSDLPPSHIEETDLGNTQANVMLPVDINYLSARYIHFTAPTAAQQITFDFNQLQHVDQLDVRLLLNTTNGWKVVHPTGGTKVSLCRDQDGYPGTEAYVVLANTAWDSGAAITGDLKLQTAPACCQDKSCWTGTASHVKSLTVPLPVGSATVNFTVDATVTWQGIPQDPTGTVFQPTGTLSVGPLTGSVGDCTMMAPVETFPITPDLGQLQLFFTPGQPPQYTGTGSSPGAASWPLTIDCPPDEGGSSTLPIAVPIWFLTGLQQWDDPTFDVIKGQHSGDGDTFTWNFTRVGD